MRFDTVLNNARKGTKPAFVEVGYGQVEPNHLSAQRTGQIYAQLPAAAAIEVLEQGQFVKYDYANEEVNFTGPGEWMLVFNEIKLYREGQRDCEFAMIKDNYNARIYSPYGEDKTEGRLLQSRFYNGKDAEGNTYYTMREAVAATYEQATTYDSEASYFTESDGVYTSATVADQTAFEAGTFYIEKTPAIPAQTYTYDKVTVDPDLDIYEMFGTDDPFHIIPGYKEKKMPEGTKMVPRVFKTNVGDIYTTNTVNETTLAVGDILAPETKAAADAAPTTKVAGILHKVGDASNAPVGEAMQWQVVKVYTMPDGQKGVKIMRIA